MDDEKKRFLMVMAFVLLALLIYFIFFPEGRAVWAKYDKDLKEASEESYENSKQVEDTARAMIASYAADILTYEQYKESEDKEQRSWAEQAKMRANKTAASYNVYVTENSHIWKDNLPSGLKLKLDIVN